MRKIFLSAFHPYTHHILTTIFSVNFKKNEKVYNPENSEVLKALQENDSEPEPGNNYDNEYNDFRD